MGIRNYKPTSPGRRGAQVSDFADLTPGAKVEKSLLEPKRRTNGRNNKGIITCRHRGGGHKRAYRLIDFRRNKDGVPAVVDSIQYDTNRTARIALLKYADGEKRLADAYKKIEGIEADIREVETDLNIQMETEATEKDAHEALMQITEKWDTWTSAEKKRLVQAWIKELHLFPKKQKSGAWIKGIVFQFPVVVFGQVSDAFDFPADADNPDDGFQQQETTDETVVLMTKQRKDAMI